MKIEREELIEIVLAKYEGFITQLVGEHDPRSNVPEIRELLVEMMEKPDHEFMVEPMRAAATTFGLHPATLVGHTPDGEPHCFDLTRTPIYALRDPDKFRRWVFRYVRHMHELGCTKVLFTVCDQLTIGGVGKHHIVCYLYKPGEETVCMAWATEDGELDGEPFEATADVDAGRGFFMKVVN